VIDHETHHPLERYRNSGIVGTHRCRQAADEYDSYVARVYMMLVYDQATAEAIADYANDTSTIVILK
jgi:hypothetical protein